MEKSLDDVKKIFDPKTFKYEILICFWLCIHLERLELAQIVLEQDSIMERVLVNMRKAGKEYLEADIKGIKPHMGFRLRICDPSM